MWMDGESGHPDLNHIITKYQLLTLKSRHIFNAVDKK